MINSGTRTSRAGKQRPAPLSIRVSEDQRAALLSRAGHQPLGAYIKDVLFGDSPVPNRASVARPPLDREALTRVLGMLGQSNLARNLETLAEAARSGNFAVDEQTRKVIEASCAEVAALRALLLEALGKQVEGTEKQAPRPKQEPKPAPEPLPEPAPRPSHPALWRHRNEADADAALRRSMQTWRFQRGAPNKPGGRP